MVHFALILPVFMFVMLSIIQWGYIFAAELILQNASAEGARYAAMSNPMHTDVVAYTRTFVTAPLSSNTAQVAFAPYSLNGQPGHLVSITYSLKLFFRFVVPGNSAGYKTLAVSTAMNDA